MVKQTSQKSMSWLTGLSIVHFSNDVMEMSISPLLPLIIKEFSLTYLMAALILVSFKTLPSFVQLVIALVSDASSKRKIIIILGLGWLSIGLWFVSISPNYTVLIVSILIVGIGTTTYHSQATVYIAHYFSEVRGKGMGIHGIGGGLARIATPIILGVFGLFFGWRVALRFITIPGIICVVILAIILKEIGSSKRVRIRIREAISRSAIIVDNNSFSKDTSIRKHKLFLTYLLCGSNEYNHSCRRYSNVNSFHFEYSRTTVLGVDLRSHETL